MKILEVNTFHFERGGDSLYMLRLSHELARRGHEVRHFAMHHHANLPAQESTFFADEVDYPGLMAQGGLAAALRVMTTAIYNRNARRRIAELLDEWRPDVAHLHSVMHHLTASIVLELRRRGIPLVWTLHDAKSVCPTTLLLRNGQPCQDCAQGRFYRAVTQKCKRGKLAPSLIVAAELYLHRWWKIYERADLLITPSQFLHDKVLEMGLKPRRIEVAPNFVVMDRAVPPSSGRSYYLYVGRISREKGVETLVSMAEQMPELQLRIAGTGELLDSLRERSRLRGLEDRVRFLGHVTGADLQSLYASAKALLVPSACHENCPLVVLEAFAHGTPVVASRMGGLPEIVIPGETGELVAPGEVPAWVATIRRLAAAPGLLESYGNAGRERTETVYEVRAHGDRIESLMLDVVGDSPGG